MANTSSEGHCDDEALQRAYLLSNTVGDEITNRKQKFIIWKNVIVIGLSFMCLFTAFGVATVLQSSLNAKNGLGTISHSIIHITTFLSSMFVPSLMIGKLGLKWTMVLCQLCFSSYIGAQFYPSFATLIPTAVLVGIASAPLWAAQSTYITQAGIRYAKLANDNKESLSVEPAITRFFGVFFMVMRFSSVWGNLINSFVLSNGSSNSTEISDERLSLCGVNFCYEEFANLTTNKDSSSSIDQPIRNRIELLFGIMLGFSILAAIILAFLFDSDPQRDENSPNKSGCEMLIATFHQIKNPYQILIIPLTMWTGFAPTFASAELTQAFIACAWGVEHIGYVVACHGLTAALSSIIFGNLVKWTGRMLIFLLGASINLSLILVMLFYWNPNPNHPEMFYIFGYLWGIGNAVWNTQLNSFYGVIFEDRKEAGFSNLRLWKSLGFGIAFAYSNYLCVKIKLYILVCVLVLGLVGYLSIEMVEYVKNNSNNNKKRESYILIIDSDKQ